MIISIIKKTLLTCLGILVVGSLATPVATYASDAPSPSSKTQACIGLTSVDDTQDCNNKGSEVAKILSAVLSTLAVLAGMISVVMIILGGFRYIISDGDAAKVSKAKNTILYAIIGLIIAALAQALVIFVIDSANKRVTACPYNGSISVTNDKCVKPKKP